MLKGFIRGIMAGILISIGGSVFLACDVKYVGAILFSVALLCICYKGYALFTGKVGYIPESHKKEDVKLLIMALLGNFAATYLVGRVIGLTNSSFYETAQNLCAAKLSQNSLQTFVRATMCGILMYLAVSIYRDKKTVIAILFCIPVFILSGFEHSIANMFYFAVGDMYSIQTGIYLLIVVIGNSVGGMLLPALEKIGDLFSGK